MHVIRLIAAAALATGLAGGAQAQSGFDDRAPPPPRMAPPPPSGGFNTTGDTIPPSHDPAFYGHYDPRYSQTFQQQQAEPPRPGGGCLRYGAVGAAGGHLAGHGVAGALAGCAIGHFVRRRDQARINEQYGQH